MTFNFIILCHFQQIIQLSFFAFAILKYLDFVYICLFNLAPGTRIGLLECKLLRLLISFSFFFFLPDTNRQALLEKSVHFIMSVPFLIVDRNSPIDKTFWIFSSLSPHKILVILFPNADDSFLYNLPQQILAVTPGD